MAYLLPSDLKSHIYQEILDEIIRNENDIALDAIASAIDMAKSYLSKYDLTALFGTGTIAATTDSAILKRMVKNIAIWYVLTLCNANIDMELFSKKYDESIQWLRDIQKGMSNPDWPYKDVSTQPTPANGDSISYSSNPKRNNHW